MTPEQEQRLLEVQLSQTRLETVVTDNIQITEKLLIKHDKTLYGTDLAPGMDVRLDREEQKSKNITRVIWIIVTTSIGLGATALAAAIF